MAQPNLHGLTLPTFKAWGRRKRHLSLGCTTTHHRPSSAPWDIDMGLDHEPEADMVKPSPSPPPLHEGFDQIRRNLMAHLRHAANELNLRVPPQPDDPDAHVEGHPLPPVARRPRRRAHLPGRDSSPSPPPPRAPTTRSSRARSLAERAEKKRRRFSVTLSREEIDEDFYALTGRRAPGRPRRRPPAVRKHVDVVFPGLDLSDVTAASYEVAPPRVRNRGG